MFCRSPAFILPCGRGSPRHDFATRAAGFRGGACDSGEGSSGDSYAKGQELHLGHKYGPSLCPVIMCAYFLDAPTRQNLNQTLRSILAVLKSTDYQLCDTFCSPYLWDSDILLSCLASFLPFSKHLQTPLLIYKPLHRPSGSRFGPTFSIMRVADDLLRTHLLRNRARCRW